jgi:hypothetical protein
MIQRKLNGDSNESIAEWVLTQYGIEVGTKALWNIFKKCIPDLLLKMDCKPAFFEENQIKGVMKQIEDLESLIKIQFDRIKSQWFDELDQAGNPRMNPQTGEVEYSGTNKNFNETARVYNQLVKTVIELKMAVGLVRKEPERIEIESKQVMDKTTRAIARSLVRDALDAGPDCSRFIQPTPNDTISDAEYGVIEDDVEKTDEIKKEGE